MRTLTKPQDRANGSGLVDYSLARRATLRAFAGGRLSRLDVCDAHPELLRAAKFCGEKTTTACPICEKGPVVCVRYVYSDELSKRENGMVWSNPDLRPLTKFRDARLYTVEVCPDCSWNHLRSQVTLGHGGRSRAKRGSRAST